MNTGILPTESAEEYHANQAVSHSKLEVFAQRPALYKRTYIDKATEKEATDALTFGDMFHTATLQPELFEKRFYVAPKCDRRTKEGKAMWDACSTEAGERIIITSADMADAKRMADAIHSNPLAHDLLTASGGCPEVSFRTPILSHGRFAVQCRADKYNPYGCEASHGQSFVLDIKSCADLDAFKKHFHEFAYYRQAPFYQRVISTVAQPVRAFYFIAVEKDEPFGCTVFECDQLSIDTGLREIASLLGRLEACYAENIWPNAPMHSYATLPTWFLEKRAA